MQRVNTKKSGKLEQKDDENNEVGKREYEKFENRNNEKGNFQKV